MQIQIRLPLTRIVALCSLAVAAAAQGAGSFDLNTTDIPQGSPFNDSSTENVDFGDIDLDGDWDAIFADGGDSSNDQDRVWINMGGLQGGTLGLFVDQTATRFPAILADGRDIEFADIDKDGDLDIYGAKTSNLNNQTNRWWVNMGGLQGGTPGFYQDQTAARWINVGVNNGTTFSSVAPGMVLGSGGFTDWSCDCDFGDLDNDGDLDLVHSTYGGAFGGKVPTRLFLNTSGNFEEFNPSHFQLAGTDILTGNPAIWAEGTQQPDTSNSTGANADVASSALDVEVGDIDNDLDLDILHGARQEPTRMFRNRLQENGGVLAAFRDVSTATYPPNWAPGNGHYAQEMGDLDQDDDLDIYGLNWQVGVGGPGLHDCTLENLGAGTGVYGNLVKLTNSQLDDNEGDFIDYDNDGDLDLLVSNFSGQEKLYRNNFAGAGFSYTYVTVVEMPFDDTISLDADGCDVDRDGDYDAFVANDNFTANAYLKNKRLEDDTHAAKVSNLEQAPNRIAGPNPTVIRVHVYDNAPYYINWYNVTTLEYSLNGSPFTSVPMRNSGGQIFRGQIPGAWVGTVAYRVRTQDEYGNVALSITKKYNATAGGCSGSPVVYCTAKTNSLACIPAITWIGVPSATAGTGFEVRGTNVRNNKSGLLFYGVTGQNSGPFQGGTLCVKPPIRRTPGVFSGGTPAPANDCTGVYSVDMNAFAVGALGGTPLAALTVPGTVVDCQFWGRDPGFPAPNNTTLTDGLEYTVCP